MATIHIRIPGPPVAKGRPRFGKGNAYTPKKTAEYERTGGWLVKQAMQGRKPFEGPVCVQATYWMPVPRSWSKKRRERALAGLEKHTSKPDLDNLQKLTLDMLNKIAFADDAQVVEMEVAKKYGREPHAAITIEALAHEGVPVKGVAA